MHFFFTGIWCWPRRVGGNLFHFKYPAVVHEARAYPPGQAPSKAGEWTWEEEEEKWLQLTWWSSPPPVNFSTAHCRKRDTGVCLKQGFSSPGHSPERLFRDKVHRTYTGMFGFIAPLSSEPFLLSFIIFLRSVAWIWEVILQQLRSKTYVYEAPPFPRGAARGPTQSSVGHSFLIQRSHFERKFRNIQVPGMYTYSW